MRVSRLLMIMWPAFLAAGLLTMLVFAMVDPQDLHWFGHPLAMSRAGVYTLAFFAFWAIVMVAGGMTALLATPDIEIED